MRIVLALLLFCVQASAADSNIVRVAHGASVQEFTKRAMDIFRAGGGKAELVRELGMSGDSVLLSVDSGNATVGVSGNSWDNLLEVVTEKKLAPKNLPKINHRVIGVDQLQIVTYTGGPKQLTKDQIKELFLGKTTSWKAITGEDIPVQIILASNTPGTQKTFSKEMLDGEDIFRRGIRSTPDMTENAKAIAKTKGAIGFVSSLTDFGDVNRPKHPLIAKDITAIWIGDLSLVNDRFLKAFEQALGKK